MIEGDIVEDEQTHRWWRVISIKGDGSVGVCLLDEPETFVYLREKRLRVVVPNGTKQG